MSSSVLSSLDKQPSVLVLIKHELRIYLTASKSSDVDQLILALLFRLGYFGLEIWT